MSMCPDALIGGTDHDRNQLRLVEGMKAVFQASEKLSVSLVQELHQLISAQSIALFSTAEMIKMVCNVLISYFNRASAPALPSVQSERLAIVP